VAEFIAMAAIISDHQRIGQVICRLVARRNLVTVLAPTVPLAANGLVIAGAGCACPMVSASVWSLREN
jgi:hypothetical protein